MQKLSFINPKIISFAYESFCIFTYIFNSYIFILQVPIKSGFPVPYSEARTYYIVLSTHQVK